MLSFKGGAAFWLRLHSLIRILCPDLHTRERACGKGVTAFRRRPHALRCFHIPDLHTRERVCGAGQPSGVAPTLLMCLKPILHTRERVCVEGSL